MANDPLGQFVKEALAKGEPREKIQSVLEAADWPKDQVSDALNAYADVEFPVPVPRPRRFGSAREAFLYIVYFVLLGMVAIYVGRLAFAWIEYIFDDTIFQRSLRSGVSGMRWAVASLLVGYPVFLFLGWRLSQRRRQDPERRTSRVRAWLTYIALIFAATALIGDLVYVVFRFLDGELGARFLSKAGVVAAISGAILLNYTRDAERVSAGVDWIGRGIAILTTFITAVLLIWAFTMINSPFTARSQASDEQRISDLGVITRLVDCHRSYFNETPATLADLEAKLQEQLLSGKPLAQNCNAKMPKDPRSGEAYLYKRLDADRYEFCTSFEWAWPESNTPVPNRRRRLGFLSGKDDRYIILPEQPGVTCFEFTAVDFEKSKNQDE